MYERDCCNPLLSMSEMLHVLEPPTQDELMSPDAAFLQEELERVCSKS